MACEHGQVRAEHFIAGICRIAASYRPGRVWAYDGRTVFWWLDSRASSRPPASMSQTHRLVPPAVTAIVPANNTQHCCGASCTAGVGFSQSQRQHV